MSDTALEDIPEISGEDMATAMGVEPDPDPGDTDSPAPAQETAAEGDDDPNAPPAEPAQTENKELPEYRRLAIAERENQELRSRLDQLERRLSQPLTDPKAEPKAEIDPKRKQLQDRFFSEFPEVKELVDNAKAILAAAKVAPNMAAREESRQNQQAASDLRTVTDAVAARVLGEGKTGADLRPAARERVARAFASWCGADYAAEPERMPKEMAARAERYENGDRKLFDEFVADYLSDFAPATRPDRVQAATRARAKSPIGGPASTPPPASPKLPDPNDEDALHKAAFASVRAAASAG